MTFERNPGPPPEPAPTPVVGSVQPGSGPTPVQIRLQILSTEHWSLLASRSLAWNETFSRPCFVRNEPLTTTFDSSGTGVNLGAAGVGVATGGAGAGVGAGGVGVGVGAGVGAAPGAVTAVTARLAFSRPPVTDRPPSAGLASTELSSACRSAAVEAAGSAPSSSATTPDTWGAAIEVPLINA